MPLYVKFNPEKLYRSNMSKRERVKRIADECTEKPAVATNALIVNGAGTSNTDNNYHIMIEYFDDSNQTMLPLGRWKIVFDPMQDKIISADKI